MKKNRRWIAMMLCALLLCGTSAQAAVAAEDLAAESEVVLENGGDEQILPVEEEEIPAVSEEHAAEPEEENVETPSQDENPEEVTAPESGTDTSETAEEQETAAENAEETDADTEEPEDAEEEEELVNAGSVTLEYQTHVQTYGWEKTWKKAGEMSGTQGQSKRLEGIRIRLVGADESDYIEYRTHVQTYGWEQTWAKNGEMSGTEGQSKRLEGIQIRLSPSLEEKYDLYYCVHAQNYGWLGWAKNGASAGTEGLSKRLEGIRIVLVDKGAAAPDPIGTTTAPFIGTALQYQTHVQTFGWQGWVGDGKSSGTTGQSKRLEGIRIKINENSMMTGLEGSIEYRTHVQTYGWEETWAKNGEMSGTEGQSKRLEAIQIRLVGEIANNYDVYYRVHSQTYGWLDWAMNGESAGTEGMSKRLESIQIRLVPKGGPAPGSTYAPFRKPVNSYKIPYAQPISGTRTIRNLLRTALVPCGRTLYSWGGGHGPDTNLAGMPQGWVDYFESHSSSTFEPQYTYIQYWNGVDCSGYSSWVVANTTGDRSGSAILAQNVAQAYTNRGWTGLYGTDNKTFKPGDFVSVLYGHIWISLGQCSDGSVLLIHSGGNGIQLSGTGGKAMAMASYYMKKYFPYWPYETADYSWLLGERSYTARWHTDGRGLLTDPDGMQNMSAEQVMQLLLGD